MVKGWDCRVRPWLRDSPGQLLSDYPLDRGLSIEADSKHVQSLPPIKTR